MIANLTDAMAEIGRLAQSESDRRRERDEARAEVERLQEAATMRKLADLGVGTEPIGVKLKAHMDERIATLTALVRLAMDNEANPWPCAWCGQDEGHRDDCEGKEAVGDG